jgi:hypothetical protein
VARFVDDRSSDGVLVLGPDYKIKGSELYAMYSEWARQTGEKPLGNRRFAHRVEGLGLGAERVNGVYTWTGIGRGTSVSILGTFGGWEPPDRE